MSFDTPTPSPSSTTAHADVAPPARTTRTTAPGPSADLLRRLRPFALPWRPSRDSEALDGTSLTPGAELLEIPDLLELLRRDAHGGAERDVRSTEPGARSDRSLPRLMPTRYLRHDPGTLEYEHELALELWQSCAGDLDRLHLQIEQRLEADVAPWLLGLPDRLAAAGRAELAAELTERFIKLPLLRPLSAKLAQFVALAGQTDRAHVIAERCLAESPADCFVLSELGLAMVALGQLARAEQLWRTALALCPELAPLRSDIVRRLAALLRIRQRGPEAEALLATEAEREAKALERFLADANRVSRALRHDALEAAERERRITRRPRGKRAA